MYDIIMCSSPLSKRKPDESYETEYTAAKKFTNVHLFDIFNVESVKLPKTTNGKLIYHGWMMPPAIYTKFYNKCKSFGYELINSPGQYLACHHFNGWYSSLEGLTPKSTIIEIDDIRPMMDQVIQFMTDNNCSVVIKDYVKSLKHLWAEACFIPVGANAFHVAQVLSKFMAIKQEDNDLQGNLVVRKFEHLKYIGHHNKSKMPMTKEFRTFVLNGKLLPTYKYWSQGSYSGDEPPVSFIEKVAEKVVASTKSNLFTVDVAQLANEDWTCIEVGDGQVSAVPDHEDREEFFRNLLK